MFYNSRNREVYIYINDYKNMLSSDLRDMVAAKDDGEDPIECEKRIEFIKGQQLAIKKIRAALQTFGV